jgi:transcription termination factor Rho
MSVFTRDALEGSPLADLHAIASELGIDGFRRLRKDDLIAAILERQPGGAPAEEVSDDEDAERPARARRSRGGRGRARSADDGDEPATQDDGDEAPRGRGGRGGRSEGRRRETERREDAAERPRERDEAERTVEGVVEVLANGSAFIRTGGAGTTSDDDVYVSGAQVRRCELVTGDTIAGPVRRPRRSERYASLIRVETINGGAADEVAVGTPYDELPAAFPNTPIAFKAKDATLKQIADLAPIGRGSRVSVIGPHGSGRSATLRLLAIELAAEEDTELAVVLAGARPEETAEWAAAELAPAAVAGLASSAEAQLQAIERAIDTGRRVAARGGHAAVVIDALDNLTAGAARRVLAAARNVPDGGTLTVIAAALAPVGGETTVIALDGAASYAERRPVIDPAASGTLRLELLVGARKATTIVKNRSKVAAPAKAKAKGAEPADEA